MNFLISQKINNYKNPTVTLLINYVEPADKNLSCMEVLDFFILNPAIFAVAIVNNKNIPIGIVDRQAFLELFLEPFQREIYHDKKISEFMIDRPILVDINLTLDDVSEIIIDAAYKSL